jgi:hypothetical protein
MDTIMKGQTRRVNASVRKYAHRKKEGDCTETGKHKKGV